MGFWRVLLRDGRGSLARVVGNGRCTRSWAAPGGSPLGTGVPQRKRSPLLEVGERREVLVHRGEAQIGHFVQVARTQDRQPDSPLGISGSGRRMVSSTRWASTARSSSLTGRPWHALRTPAMTLVRLNGSETPPGALHDVQARRLDGGEPTPTGRALATSDGSPIRHRSPDESTTRGVGFTAEQTVHPSLLPGSIHSVPVDIPGVSC